MAIKGPYEITYYWTCLSTDTKPSENITLGSELFETNTRTWYIWNGSAWSIKSPGLSMTTSTDPASSVAVTTAIVDAYAGVVITTTAAGNAQTIANPTILTPGKEFIVANNDTSSDSITVNSVVLAVGEAQKYFWDGSAWLTLEAVSASQISFTPTGSIAATNVQTAIAEVDLEKASLVGTETLTNKRVTARVLGTTSHATPTINTDNCDIYQLTAQAEAITSFTTNLSGTPVEGDILVIEVTGTAARAITWGTSFESSTVDLPVTTVSTDKLTVGFLYNDVTNKWRCVGAL